MSGGAEARRAALTADATSAGASSSVAFEVMRDTSSCASSTMSASWGPEPRATSLRWRAWRGWSRRSERDAPGQERAPRSSRTRRGTSSRGIRGLRRSPEPTRAARLPGRDRPDPPWRSRPPIARGAPPRVRAQTSGRSAQGRGGRRAPGSRRRACACTDSSPRPLSSAMPGRAPSVSWRASSTRGRSLRNTWRWSASVAVEMMTRASSRTACATAGTR